MDYEKKYNEALKGVRRLHDRMKFLSSTDALVASSELEFMFPELAESEDERIRKWLIAELKDDYFTDYTPDESKAKAEKAIAWLEKQKEQKHTLKFKVGDKVHMEGDDSVILTITEIKEDRYLTDCGPILFGAEDIWQIVEQKPAEWSEEDKEKIVTISEIIEHCTTIPYSGGTLTLNKEYKKELLCFIKSLRPSWKPSEDELTKKHLEGYIKGRNDALREMSDFMESHFNTQSGTSIKSGGNE